MPVEIKIDSSQIMKMLQTLSHIKNGVPRALVPAINRALSSGQTTIKREIRKEYLIKAKDIPTKLHRASYAAIGGEIRIDQGMLDATKFFYRPKVRTRRQKPLFLQIKKAGGGAIIQRGFITSGGALFQRRSTAPRLPIRKLITIGASIMASQPKVGPAANKAIGDTFAKRIDHEIKRVLASAGDHAKK
jgi:hypothetical protein